MLHSAGGGLQSDRVAAPPPKHQCRERPERRPGPSCRSDCRHPCRVCGGVEGEGVPDNLAVFAALQVVVGPIVGILVGYLAAKLLDAAIRARTVTTVFQGIFFLGSAFVVVLSAEA